MRKKQRMIAARQLNEWEDMLVGGCATQRVVVLKGLFSLSDPSVDENGFYVRCNASTPSGFIARLSEISAAAMTFLHDSWAHWLSHARACVIPNTAGQP